VMSLHFLLLPLAELSKRRQRNNSLTLRDPIIEILPRWPHRARRGLQRTHGTAKLIIEASPMVMNIWRSLREVSDAFLSATFIRTAKMAYFGEPGSA